MEPAELRHQCGRRETAEKAHAVLSTELLRLDCACGLSAAIVKIQLLIVGQGWSLDSAFPKRSQVILRLLSLWTTF